MSWGSSRCVRWHAVNHTLMLEPQSAAQGPCGHCRSGDDASKLQRQRASTVQLDQYETYWLVKTHDVEWSSLKNTGAVLLAAEFIVCERCCALLVWAWSYSLFICSGFRQKSLAHQLLNAPTRPTSLSRKPLCLLMFWFLFELTKKIINNRQVAAHFTETLRGKMLKALIALRL